jgi:hypothetical protein
MAGAVGGAGAQAAPTGQRRAGAAVGGAAQLTLTRLASLSNYSFQIVTVSGRYSFEVTGEVHGPTDWRISSKAPATTTYDVEGQGWSVALGHVSRVRLRSPQGWSHLAGERTFAQGLMDLTHVTGMKVVAGAACTGAGRAGTTYRLELPAADKAIFDLLGSACVARQGGALLYYHQGVAGGTAAGSVHLTGDAYTFSVTSIGHVGAIAAPRPQVTTTTSPVAVPRPTGSLPPGYPKAVPVPPGKVTTAARMSANKWYLLLSEGHDSHALSEYATELRKRGFSVKSRVSAAGIAVEVLASRSYQVQLELLALPGDGEQLTVTIKAS